MTTEEKLALFERELNLITEPNLKRFVSDILVGTGEWFYHDPASTSGRYHPKYALGDGGLVRHTKAVVYWLWEMYRSKLFDIDEHQIQLLTVGAICHDIRKHDNNGKYIATHARAAHDLILESQSVHPDMMLEGDAQYIAGAIATHMGIWGVKDGEAAPNTDAEKILHLADLMASRKEVSIDFLVKSVPGCPAPVESVPVFESKSDEQNGSGGDFVMPFGKCKGMTLREIDKAEHNYLLWMKENITSGNIKYNIILYLKDSGIK